MIRKGQIKDIEEIYNLSKTLETTFKKETLAEYINSKETNYIFVVELEKIVGFIIVWENDFNGQIIDLVVEENFQNKGYGKMLLNQGIEFLKAKGVKTISLEVAQKNFKAKKLYESCGFKMVKTIKNYYQNDDGLLYVRSLESENISN